MDRQAALDRIASREVWDLVIIGGGATGLGTAVDAAARGFKTLLLEQQDFAKGTSSRSTKLVHGGVRYLQQGNLTLVRDALRERGLLLRNAPHLVSSCPFVIPCYAWWERPYYRLGMRAYDLLAGRWNLARSRRLSREDTLQRLPTLEAGGLRGGVLYEDGQFDDARLAITLARTAVVQGACLANYVQVTRVIREQGRVAGVAARDLESQQEYVVRSRVVVNATGVFSDAVCRLDDPEAAPRLAFSQGIHLVLDPAFLRGSTALMAPRTEDGRVLFAIPWHQRVVLGTTDTPLGHAELEPRAARADIEYLLRHAARYLSRPPQESDVRAVFAGIRPLVRGIGKTHKTSALSRDHVVLVSESQLVTVTGGKWTTYRKMAEDTVDTAIAVGDLPQRPCRTRELSLHGAPGAVPPGLRQWDDVYGTDQSPREGLLQQRPQLRALLHERLPYRELDVVWGARHEMARTVEDVLARRTRALFLDAQASRQIAPRVAALLAAELGRSPSWAAEQVQAFDQLAEGFSLSACGS